jgi:7-cyano-7-deazaguanine synthase in queuosine biosynthesis
LIAPFSKLAKFQELNILKELDGKLTLTQFTLTCYNPNDQHESCGECPSCSERIANFAKVGEQDLIVYSKIIPWDKLIEKMKV